jgi:phenylalanyl-tRNA synthetase alpha subunit
MCQVPRCKRTDAQACQKNVSRVTWKDSPFDYFLWEKVSRVSDRCKSFAFKEFSRSLIEASWVRETAAEAQVHVQRVTQRTYFPINLEVNRQTEQNRFLRTETETMSFRERPRPRNLHFTSQIFGCTYVFLLKIDLKHELHVAAITKPEVLVLQSS